MLYNIIKSKKNEWLNSNECQVNSIFEYIKSEGKLREAQIEALETYLYFKIKCNNKPLWQLFSEGTFNYEIDLNNIKLTQKAREFFEKNIEAKSLYLLASFKNGTKSLMPELAEHILNKLEKLNYISIIKEMFYGINYTDYLFSLPMGAGKTFLMASIAYLDLYFAVNEPDNKNFAHNFLILIPSGLKTSIIPSLKSIEKFDPTWIIPEPAASHIKSIIKFEVLDEFKAKKRSTQTNNPNVQKINQHQPFEDIMGLFLIVNAEKVVLNRTKIKDGKMYELNEDEIDKQANELRNKLGKIPNLQIHIDEYHHLVSSTILLRQVVTKWNGTKEHPGNINSVLGFSGTPYNDEKINLTENLKIKFHQITNTIYYYPLITAIKQFLKIPKTITYKGVEPLYIVKNGVSEFLNEYDKTIYKDGTCAKLAIYCGTIENLENNIYPYLVNDLNIPENEILRFHKGDNKKKFPMHPNSEINFAYLDTPSSKFKIILLVQIGKEGWDCRSLTGVILSNKDACPTNMVLQTSCRCLRQIETIDNQKPTAKIWLNADNSQLLNMQLQAEQNTNINEFNNITISSNIIERYSRLEKLNNPQFDFVQFKITYETKIHKENKSIKDKLNEIISILEETNNIFLSIVIIDEANFEQVKNSRVIINNIQGRFAHFDLWLHKITKDSFNLVKYNDLYEHKDLIFSIFQKITLENNNELYFNDLYKINEIESKIRIAFHELRYVEEKVEYIPKIANMLIVEKLKSIEDNPLLYPKKDAVLNIIASDNTDVDIIAELEITINKLKSQGLGMIAETIKLDDSFKHKDKTLHYIPYNFKQSKFELTILENILNLDTFSQLNLEIFYNGEKELSDFRIDCYKKSGSRWKRVGLYTPDFLIINRENNIIDKVLILETKGSGFVEQSSFIDRVEFVKGEFLKINNDNQLENNNIPKFEFIYLEDSNSLEQNIAKINHSIANFFTKQLN